MLAYISELERETFSSSRLPPFPLTPPTPDFATTLNHNHRSNSFHPFIPASVPPAAHGNIPAGINNNTAHSFQEDEVMVVEQAIRPSANDNRGMTRFQDGIKIMDMSVRQDQQDKLFSTQVFN